MTTLYVAAPLFTDAERAFNAGLAALLRDAFPELTVLVPQEFCAVHDAAQGGAAETPDFSAIFADCVGHLDRSDIILAVLDGPDPDSGTCWEVGYAYARKQPVLGLRSDWRPGEDQGTNCMLRRSCVGWCRAAADVPALLRPLLSELPT